MPSPGRDTDLPPNPVSEKLVSPRPVSDKQLAANRRNAGKSTGPRSCAGKARSCLNALRHGLYAETPVLPGENAARFAALCDGLAEEWRPGTASARDLVERLATLSWRLRRSAAAETALLADAFEEEDDASSGDSPDDERTFGLWDRLGRIEARHERAFARCLTQLRSLTAEHRQAEAEAAGRRGLPDGELSRMVIEARASFGMPIDDALIRTAFGLPPLVDGEEGDGGDGAKGDENHPSRRGSAPPQDEASSPTPHPEERSVSKDGFVPPLSTPAPAGAEEPLPAWVDEPDCIGEDTAPPSPLPGPAYGPPGVAASVDVEPPEWVTDWSNFGGEGPNDENPRFGPLSPRLANALPGSITVPSAWNTDFW